LRAGDHGVRERRDPTSREGVDLDQLFDEDFETEHLARHRDESETRIGHCVVVIEHHHRRDGLFENGIEKMPF
jgi:hypothetical protein